MSHLSLQQHSIEWFSARNQGVLFTSVERKKAPGLTVPKPGIKMDYLIQPFSL